MPSPAVPGVMVAAGWFFAFVALHIWGLRRGRSNAEWLLRSYALSTGGLLLTAGGLAAASGTGPFILLCVGIALLTSACLVVLYVPAVYVLMTSLSIQTMILLKENDGTLPTEDLYGHFASRVIVEKRLATLVAGGYLTESGGFRLTRRGHRTAKFFLLIKRYWNLDPGG